MANGRLTDRKDSLWTRIKRVAMTDVGALMRGLNADDIERMERVLIEADFGVPATVELTQALEDEVRRGKLKTESDLRRALERVPENTWADAARLAVALDAQAAFWTGLSLEPAGRAAHACAEGEAGHLAVHARRGEPHGEL